MYKNINLSPTLEYVDGKITSASIDSIVEESQSALTDIDKVLGTDSGTFESSIIPLLGNTNSSIIPHVSYGTLINGCADLFTTGGTEYLLSLVPSSPSTLVISGGTYTYSATENFVNTNEYTVSGRTLVFAQEPAGISFTVGYDGYVPDDYGAQINQQTLFPNPKNIADGKVSAPVVTEIDAVEYIYSISIPNETYLSGVDDEFTSPIQNTIPPFLSSYVSGTGSIETPLDYASLWVLTGSKYEKVSLEYLKIISANSFIVKSSSALVTTGTYVVSLFSKSIPDMLAEIYHAYRNHNHDGYGNTNKIDHDNIKSVTSKDYHPQYVAKTGYSNSNKSNRMSGDIFMASVDATNDNSNLLNRSNMLVFGDYAFGHTVYREPGATGYFAIDSRDSSGLNIIVNTPAEGDTGLDIIKSGASKMYHSLGVSESKTSLHLYGGKVLYLEADDYAYAEAFKTKSLKLETDAVMNIAGVSFTGTATGAVVSTETGKSITFGGTTIFTSGTFNGAEIDLLKVNLDKMISFLPTEDYLKSTSEGPVFKYRVKFSDYGKLAVVSEDNTAPTGISNVMNLSSLNPLYLTRPITTGLTVNGVQYAFRETVSGHTRIDRVQDWPRQSLFAASATLDSINLPESSFTERNGITFGNTGKIYSSTNDTDCSIDALVIESKEDVIFLKYGNSSADCDAKEFASVKISSLKANGDANVTGDITAGGEISANSLSVAEDAVIEGSATIGGNMSSETISVPSGGKIYGTLLLEDVSVKGDLAAGYIETTGSVDISGDLGVGKSASIAGGITVGKSSSFSKSLEVAEKLSAATVIASVLSGGELAVTGSAEISGTLIAGSANFRGDISTTGSVSSGSINTRFATLETISAGATEVTTFTAKGEVKLKTTTISGGLSVSEAANISGALSVGGDGVVSGTLKVLKGLNVSEGAKISDGLSVSGDLGVSGNTVMTGKLESGAATINGNIVISGSLKMEEGLATIKMLEVKSRADFQAISVATISMSGNITGTEDTYITTGEITASKLTLAPRNESGNDKFISYVDIQAMRDVYVANKLEGNLIKAKSVFTIGDADAGDAVYLTPDGLHFSKATAIIGVSSITADKLIGRTTIPYSELAQFNSSISAGIISAIEASKFTISDNLSVDGILNVPRSLVVGGTLYFNRMIPLDPELGYVDIVAGAAVYE